MGDKQITRMRGLGRFFGHVWGAVRSPAGRSERVEVRREIEEERHGRITVRRTTVEEIELPEDWRREGER
ncbi:MAG: hypothetical protein R3B57_06145 [Phycisphaerales bacterium]